MVTLSNPYITIVFRDYIELPTGLLKYTLTLSSVTYDILTLTYLSYQE